MLRTATGRVRGSCSELQWPRGEVCSGGPAWPHYLLHVLGDSLYLLGLGIQVCAQQQGPRAKKTLLLDVGQFEGVMASGWCSRKPCPGSPLGAWPAQQSASTRGPPSGQLCELQRPLP